jgi:hypothetical protein
MAGTYLGDNLNARDWSDTLTKIVTSGIMNKNKHLCQETFQNKSEKRQA